MHPIIIPMSNINIGLYNQLRKHKSKMTKFTGNKEQSEVRL
jgi:hypothetical protein